MNNITIVSAFLTDINEFKCRNVDKYIEHGKQILNIEIPKIIFIEQKIKDKYNLEDNLFTKIIVINKEELDFFKCKDRITKFKVNTNCPSKDTIEYILTMCSKTDFIERAIKIDNSNSKNYIWLDFGLRHVFKTDIEFKNAILDLQFKIYSKIRLGNIWDINTSYLHNFYSINWGFAGGVIGGNPKILILFHELVKKEFELVLTNYNTVIWEVNIWKMIYDKNKEIFSAYKCNHNSSILLEY
jgi:hypothetical protein